MTDISDKLKALRNIDFSHLSKEEAKEFTILLEELEKREYQEQATGTFLDFVKSMWSSCFWRPPRKVAQAFDDVANGKLKRLIINAA